MFYVVCYLYAPSYQEKFQVGVNLLGNKHFLILILILMETVFERRAYTLICSETHGGQQSASLPRSLSLLLP